MPITFAAIQNLVYDANGNLVTGDGKYRTYDGFNHLVQIREGNNATGTILENLTWHPVEERILVKATYETNGSWKENIYYISQSFVKVKNASGTYDYKYIYQNGQFVAQELVGEKKHFMLNDHKGTVSVVVNESGAKVEETFYSPFGEIISGGATSRFDYEGKEFDSVVGDYDYHARKYCPGSGRFCQPDTMLPNVYDPQQLNRYAFERNNPFKYIDDDGNNPVLAAMAVSALIGGLIGATVGIAIEVGAQYTVSGKIQSWDRVITSAGEGFLVGALTGALAPVGAVTAVTVKVIDFSIGTIGAIDAGISAVEYEAKESNNNLEEFDPKKKDIRLNQELPNSVENSKIKPNSVTGGYTVSNRQEQKSEQTQSVLSNKGSSSSIGFKVVTLKSGATLSASPKMQAKLSKQGLR